MPSPLIPRNDEERLRAIASYACLDRCAEAWADDVAQIVASLTGCPIGLVSIVEREDQWFKGVVGLAARGSSRDDAFCGHTVLSREPLVVEDATKDERFADSALVTGEPGIRFYVGVPLIDSDGFALGSLCAIDTTPRTIEPLYIDAMRRIASLVVTRIESSRRGSQAEQVDRAPLPTIESVEQASDLLREQRRERDDLEHRLRSASKRAATAERLVRDQQHAFDMVGIVAMTDRAGIITHVNENFCTISGYSREELLGNTHHIINSGAHDKAFFKHMYATLASGTPWRDEICNRAKDGSLYWVDTTIVPLMGDDGRPERYIALRIDITDRKNAARQLADTQERFDLAVNGSADGLWDYDPRSGEVWYSDRYWQLLGYDPERMGTHVDAWAELLHPADRERAVKAVADHIEKRSPYDVEYLIMTGRGEYRWCRSKGQAVWDEHGEALRMAGSISDIHELKTAQEELLRSKALMQHAGRLARVGGWSYDVVNDHLTWSDEVKELHEVPQDYVPNPEAGIAFYAEKSQPIIRESFERCVETGEPFDVAVDFVTATGTVRRVRSMGSGEFEGGRVVRVSGAFQDITESAQVERRLELATTAGNQGTWDWHIPSGEVVVNDLWWSMLGHARPEGTLTITRFEEIVHPDDVASVRRALSRHFEGRSDGYRVEFRMRRGEGDAWTWVLSTGRVIERTRDAEPLRMVGVHTDITEQRCAREELEALEERLRLFVEHTPAAVAMFDRDMRYLVASEGWFREYGLAEQELIGRSHYDVFPTVPERWKRLHVRAMGGEVLSSDRDCFEREDGEFTWVRWQLRPWHDERGEIGGIVMFTEVINEQVEHERRLEESMRAAESASLAKSEFLANMSHEIRTPMTAILGFADVLREDRELGLAPSRRLECIDTIRRNGHHLLAIINDILDMSKIEAGKMTVERVETSMVTIVEEVVSLMRVRAAGKGVDVRVSYRTGMPDSFRCDPTRLRQIVMNLVGNAIKFTEVGSVSLVAACDPREGSISLDVIDTGIGMDENQLASVLEFGAFNQADGSMTRRFGGTGLGLRISHALADILGGRITAASRFGTGSTFTLTLRDESLVGAALHHPGGRKAEPAHALHAGDPQRADTDALKGVRVLLAEDGPDNQRLISFHLRRSGAAVQIAENGALAVKAVHERAVAGQRFDVVLMDMQMPELDGYGASHEIRQLGHTMPIIALTAHAMEGDREKCLAAGCNDYLTKPIDKVELIERCAHWAGREGDRSAA
ncbi:MAG: PAS domain-containing protein [Planctomycetota bacterium]